MSKDAGSEIARSMVEQFLCPITSELPVCPVVAQDGRVYERDAIETWFESKATSPLTREPMGKRLVDSSQTRSLIRTAIENGGVDDDSAAAWHLESAKAIAGGKLVGALTSMKDHLESADALSSSPEIKLSLEAVNLKLQQDTLLKRGSDAGADLVALVLGGAKTGDATTESAETPLARWRELRPGKSIIRIISDASLLKQHCERPPRGADGSICWMDELANLCGQTCRVKENDVEGKGYCVLDAWYVPFKACILVAL